MANACKHPVASQIYLESLQLVWLRVILFRELRRALTQMGWAFYQCLIVETIRSVLLLC